MVEIKETDFPRDTQKKVQNKKRKAKNIDGDEPNPKKQLKGAKEGKGKKVETSWVHHISRELFVDGLMGVGIISEIFDDHLLLETSSPIKVTVPIGEISKQFAKAYNDGKITLEDAFSVGQALQFRVLPKNKKDLPKVVKATCNPTKLNSHLTPSMLSTGLVLLSTVSSVQEKGAILDIGLDKIQGFVATEKLQSPKLTVGQPLMVRIESVQSRVVQVTAFVEQDNLCMGACEKLQLNHLTPGTIIDCEPTDDEPTATGVMVSIGNGLKGILPRKNLPPRLRESTANLGKSVRATVVFCQQNSNVLVLNAHPDIVALSKPERRTAFEGYNLGDKLKCTVFDLVLSSSTAYLHLPLKDGKKSLVTAVCQKSFMNKTEKVESDFEIGSEKECRVMGFRFMERSLVVATRSDILKQKFVSYNEAICGQVADAKVRHVSKGGVFLIVEHFIRGFMPITMISDKGASFVRTKFPIDSNVKVKLWDVDSSKKRVIVTTRESIMEAKGPAVKTTEDVVEGALYPAVIIQKFVTGALLMKTYHGVCGVMLGKHAQALESDANNVVVLVQVESIIDEKITFVPADSEKSKGKKGVQRPKRVDEHLEVSKSVHGEAKIEKQGAPVRVTVDANKVNVTLTIEDHFLSDRLETPTATIRGALTKPKNLTNLVPLGKVNGENRAIVSGYASYWLKRNSQPANFEELKEKQVVLVVVTQSVAESGTFAELVGGSGLFGRVELPEDVKDVIELGQLLLCSVKKIDDTKKQFVLELTQNSDSPKEVIDEFALPLLKSIVEDSFWITENSEFPAIGTTVNAKVKNDAAALTIAQFTHNGKKLSGVVVAKGKLTKKSTFVVADVNPESSEIVLAVQDSEKPHIVVNRKDYTCAVDKNGIIILPSRIHINQLKTEPESGDVEVLDAVEFKSVRIAYTANSLKLAEKFLSQELTTKKTRKEKEEKKSVSTSSTKVFGIYDAVVVDEQKADKHCKKPTLFAQLTMPGGSKGRLHVSELAAKRRNVTGDAIRSFISANKKKSLLVKVIGYTKIGSDRVADVTMREEKMEATKNRQKELNYKSNFKVGDKVECYSSTTDDDQKTRFEINGVWVGSAAKENLPDEYLVNRGGTSEIVDVGIPRGTRLTATILSINNKKNHVELTFKGAAKDTSKKAFVIGETLTGRIFSVSRKPINAMIKLESGHQAVLSPTALTSNYEKVVDIVKKTCEEGKMMKVVAVKLTSAPKRYFVASLERYEATEDVDRRPLLKEREDVKENEKYDGLIVKREKSAFHVEIGPGIVVKVKLGAENGQLKSLQINSVVTVKVTEVPEEGPINADLINVLTTVIDKKRSAADSEDAPASKQKKVEKEDGSKVVPVVDPGFDWNDTAFQSESLAAVGKLTTETVVSEKKPKQQKSAEDEDEEVTEEELQKQVRSEPNSALVWIKYLTLFLEKNDLTAARATAERALQTISYKEDAEMANMWTAYLNMEVAYGDAASVQKVFERACSNADSFSIHKKLAQIYENAKKMEEAKTIYEAMVKKFRADHHEVWTMFAEHHMANGNTKAARDLLPRALDSTHKKNHVQILQKFALIEFKNGDKERAKTIFESLCTEYKKKTDIWLVYADAAIKNVGIELARSILERAVAVGNSIHMLRPLYKKWLTIEEQHGDAESISLVKNKAEKYLQSVADSINKE